MINGAGRVQVAVKFDVTTKRQRGKAPARALAVDEVQQLRPESERKDIDLDAAPASDGKMPQLVEKHHDTENEHERNDVTRVEI